MDKGPKFTKEVKMEIYIKIFLLFTKTTKMRLTPPFLNDLMFNLVISNANEIALSILIHC